MTAKTVMLVLLAIGVLAVLVEAWMRRGRDPARPRTGISTDTPPSDPTTAEAEARRDDAHMFNRIIK